MTIPAGPLRPPRNLVPLPYRNVSVQPYDGAMTRAGLESHLLGKEAYRRTEYVVLRAPAGGVAVVALHRAPGAPGALFSRIEGIEVLALPESCRWANLPEVDCANRTALAAAAEAHGVGSDGTLVVQGRYDHVNFIHRPDPLPLRVIEVVPPHPPKLFDLVKRVLEYADLPPFRVELERIDLLERARAAAPTGDLLVPCRSGGLDAIGGRVHFLDERPKERGDWTLLGCERSVQFHRHYYGDVPPRVEICPRKLAGDGGGPALVKCCLLEFERERQGNLMVVPWGSGLSMVEAALRAVAMEAGHG